MQAGLLSYPIEFEGIKSRLFSCTRVSGNSIVFRFRNKFSQHRKEVPENRPKKFSGFFCYECFFRELISCMPIKLIDIHASQPEHTPQGSRFQLVMERNDSANLSIISCF